ncbi:MAG: hypothetical protein ACRYG4_25220, partial [Janthinobacterium lividum]
ALGQVRKSAQGSEANAYLQLMDRYSAPEMRESIVALAKLWRVAQARNEPVLTTYLHLLDADKIVADTLFGHCRRVSSYFIDTTRLYTARLISKKVFFLGSPTPASTPSTRSPSRSTSTRRADIIRCGRRWN